MTLLHRAAGAVMTVCPTCARRVALVYRAGELLLGQHAMPRPSNERWSDGDACPGASIGRVGSVEEKEET